MPLPEYTEKRSTPGHYGPGVAVVVTGVLGLVDRLVNDGRLGGAGLQPRRRRLTRDRRYAAEVRERLCKMSIWAPTSATKHPRTSMGPLDVVVGKSQHTGILRGWWLSGR
jgi:hypothetical protein